MGTFWDLWQENEIDYQRQQTDSLEERVYALEETLTATITLLQAVIKKLENEYNEDIDGDGYVG